MVNIGGLYSDGEAVSAARQNATSIMSGTGTAIAAVPSTQQVGAFHAYDTSSGFTLDELYIRSADGLTFLNVRRKHLHNAALDTSGGTLNDIFVYNPRVIQYGWDGFNSRGDFYTTKTGQAAVNQIVDNINGFYYQLNSTYSGTAGEYVNFAMPTGNSPLGFTEKIVGMVTMICDFSANQVVRVGFGMEEVQNTTDTTRKLGLEGCDSTGTAWQAVTCNGTTRTVTASGMPIAPNTSMHGYKIYFDPVSASCKFTNSDGLIKLVTSTIPSGGQIDPNRVWRQGIQTTNSTVKNMYVSHIQFVGKNVSSIWFDDPTT
jgi:hypothetical protein